jgi:hypothetical protein
VDQPDGRRFRVLTVRGDAPAAAVRSSLPAIAAAQASTRGLQRLALDEIRTAFGAGWPLVAEQVHRIAVERISEQLQPGDSFEPGSDNSYFLKYGRLDEEQGTLAVTSTLHRIRRSVIEAFGNPQLVEFATGNSEDAARLVLARQTLEQSARKAIRQVLRDEPVTLQRIVRSGEQPSAFWRIGCPVQVQDLLPRTLQSTIEVDSFLLGKAAEQIYRRLLQPGSGFVIVPLDWRSVATPRAEQLYLNLCSELPDAIRERMMFELTGLTPSMESSRLSEILARLRRVGCGAAVELQSLDQHMLPLASLGVDLVTLDAGLLDLQNGRTKLAALRHDLLAAKARLLLTNVASRRAGSTYTRAGIELMTGPAYANMELPMRKAAPVVKRISMRPAHTFTVAQRTPYMVP